MMLLQCSRFVTVWFRKMFFLAFPVLHFTFFLGGGKLLTLHPDMDIVHTVLPAQLVENFEITVHLLMSYFQVFLFFNHQ